VIDDLALRDNSLKIEKGRRLRIESRFAGRMRAGPS
jgi:hypothetical protein